MKLPKRELPKYTGDVRGWLAFWAAFEEIDEGKDVPDAEKYQYLVQSTVPESDAWKVVMSYPMSGKNYDKAVEDLKERLGSEKMLIKVESPEVLLQTFVVVLEGNNGYKRKGRAVIATGSKKSPCKTQPLQTLFGQYRRVKSLQLDVSGIPKSSQWIEECDRQGIQLTDLCSTEVLIAMNGWVPLGKLLVQSKKNASQAMTVISMHMIDEQVKSMQALEVIGTVARCKDGRYQVNLPWAEGHLPLPTNGNLAERRLQTTVGKLVKEQKIDGYHNVPELVNNFKCPIALPDNSRQVNDTKKASDFISCGVQVLLPILRGNYGYPTAEAPLGMSNVQPVVGSTLRGVRSKKLFYQ
ncbi:hypothetical protein ILUMI_09048 [Ignelater luminosus]|uniref:Uncharacterized protein n=1 Tax=Ignelater luminosus TaxID=2038154 RepID=A0A8K0D6I4_IGNLU|nr:hypothetical protein ILUMI_09048 [Ignelater luminosus]